MTSDDPNTKEIKEIPFLLKFGISIEPEMVSSIDTTTKPKPKPKPGTRFTNIVTETTDVE